jgi:hypothetical protein
VRLSGDREPDSQIGFDAGDGRIELLVDASEAPKRYGLALARSGLKGNEGAVRGWLDRACLFVTEGKAGIGAIEGLGRARWSTGSGAGFRLLDRSHDPRW